ncbi:tetratricopeptide repeat protein [Salipaludibacillus sp. LMS25]|jgi:response regulator aspartate phosphatase I|uniref:Rap family tetratricopeptide repeat protein n=1 Tax=Salipaludibacillus sp. LMS25 TaxID=2924031 RepID=UPI0020D15AF2|nr:Rap family tetratricopeptide repeat protein [Salipaludibacillus sp. LMS25]UTR16904.1 tetratricopeptide repeat protein [Salipaludibacillus sp. LMS25]
MAKVETKIDFEKVAFDLNEWYRVIKQNNIPKATAMREKIIKALPDMEKNQNVLLYFNLIDSRFKLMTENYSESGNLLGKVKYETLETTTDDMIQYYFYLFNGMYRFYEKDFIKAISSYRVAESKLNKVPDEIERAEFHYQTAITYYEIRQNFFSLNHAERALESFKAHEGYINRVIKCHMIFAMNKVDLQLWDEAISLYKRAIQIASENKEGYSESLGYFNLGICYERQEKLLEALECFEKTLSFTLSDLNCLTIRNYYMLSRTLYKLGSHEIAREWRNKAITYAESVNEHVYKTKLNLIYFLYDETNSASFDENMNILKEQHLWSDVADLSLNAALYYKKQENTDLSSKYFEEACTAKDQILKFTEALS